MNEILWCDHSNETSRSSAVFRICGEILWCDHLNEGTLTWYGFLFYNSRVSWNEIWDFS